MTKLQWHYFWLHRFWIILLAISITLITTSSPLLRVAEEKTSANLAHIKTQRVQAEQTLRQLQDDVAAAQKLGTQMTLSEAEQFLTPVDRLLAANELEHEAAVSHIQHFDYTLAPEQRMKKSSTLAEPQELFVSTVTISGEAPSDIDIYRFISRMPLALPGKLRLQQLSLDRMSKESAVSTYNVRFNATLEWLSNGTTQDVAGGL